MTLVDSVLISYDALSPNLRLWAETISVFISQMDDGRTIVPSELPSGELYYNETGLETLFDTEKWIIDTYPYCKRNRLN